MTHTLEELQSARDALTFICRTLGWLEVVPPYGDSVERTKETDKAISLCATIRTLLDAAISKMETVGAENAHTDGLLPCPFCGSKDIGGIAYTASPAEVHCYGCGATITGKGIEATNKWNTRAEPQGVDAFDYHRVKEWAVSNPRKPANQAFTDSTNRQVAYLIDDIQAAQKVEPIEGLEEAVRTASEWEIDFGGVESDVNAALAILKAARAYLTLTKREGV